MGVLGLSALVLVGGQHEVGVFAPLVVVTKLQLACGVRGFGCTRVEQQRGREAQLSGIA